MNPYNQPSNPHYYYNTHNFGAYGSSKYRNIESWLKTRKLLDNFSDKYIDNNPKFLEEIVIKIFGSWKKLIYHIIDDVDKNNRYNDIYQILEIEKQKYDEYDTNDQKHENEENKKHQDCYFDKLSLTSITNICGYLDKNDIEIFKCTSSSIAIQCLLEMKKCIKINVFNMNEFNHYYKYNYLSIASSLSTFKEFKNDRYPQHIASNGTSLIDIWSNKYQIPPKNIILLRVLCAASGQNQQFLKMILDSEIMSADQFYQNHFIYSGDTFDLSQLKHERNQWYISILDKTKALFINSHGKLIAFHDDLELNNHVFMLLYYFNIKKQNIQFCKTMIIENKAYSCDQIAKFIENNIDSLMENIHDDDNKEFMEVFNNISAQHPKITIFSDYDGSSIPQLYKNLLIIFGLHDSEYVETAKNRILNERFYSDPMKLRYNVRQRLKIRQENGENLKGDEKKRDLKLNTISPDILENICLFLNKEDKTSRVKLICTSIAIICLNGMELSHDVSSLPIMRTMMEQYLEFEDEEDYYGQYQQNSFQVL